jgi:phosphatidylglycerol:prolipoprotein diacylglycerol transferase
VFPDLFHIAGGTIHTYGVLIAIGFLLGIVTATRQARHERLDPERVLDLGFWALVSGFIGARALHVLADLRHYVVECRGSGAPRALGRALTDCAAVLKLWEGGLAWYGGFFLALLTAWWFARRRGINFARLGDVVVPSVPLGHFFGRIGCLAGGCCFGQPTDSGIGVTLGPRSLAFHDLWEAGVLPAGAARTTGLHPTQLYEAIAELGVFFLLLWLRPRKRFHGQLLLSYVLAYSLLRLVIEMFRGDITRGYIVEWATPAWNRLLNLPPAAPSFLSFSQLIGVVASSTALVLLLRGRRRTARAPGLSDAPVRP